MTTTTKQVITSPVGKIIRMSLDKPQLNSYNNKEEYYIQLLFSTKDAAGQAFKDTVAKVNPNIIVTGSYTMGGNTVTLAADEFLVRAKSQYQPKVHDAESNRVTEVPKFTTGSTGTAIMETTVFTAKKGGGLNLTGVAILDLDIAEQVYTESKTTTNLRDAINKIKTA